MSFGIGSLQTAVAGYGDADSWGGPVNGVDILQHSGIDTDSVKAQKSVDFCMFLTIIGALVLLWVLGGLVFKNARL